MCVHTQAHVCEHTQTHTRAHSIYQPSSPRSAVCSHTLRDAREALSLHCLHAPPWLPASPGRWHRAPYVEVPATSWSMSQASPGQLPAALKIRCSTGPVKTKDSGLHQVGGDGHKVLRATWVTQTSNQRTFQTYPQRVCPIPLGGGRRAGPVPTSPGMKCTQGCVCSPLSPASVDAPRAMEEGLLPLESQATIKSIGISPPGSPT